MEKIIYVDIEPDKPFLTQYTRRLLLDCAKGTKVLKSNDYLKLDDVFKSDEKINTTTKIVGLNV